MKMYFFSEIHWISRIFDLNLTFLLSGAAAAQYQFSSFPVNDRNSMCVSSSLGKSDNDWKQHL